ncbi:MAG: nucleotide pyrophosphohydrolase, partial [Euryarchaeota archaeon]|nr:nucleotide pyrophosphohydrolase [Euryarchaeota archaeon]
MCLDDLVSEISNFVSERDWEQFHNPKNIAMSISIEAGELLECLQWDSPTASEIISDEKRLNQLADEIADVQIYLLRMCSMLEIDPVENSKRKLLLN